MSKKSGLGNLLYVHGANLSGDIGSVDNISSPRGVTEIPGINSASMERLLTHQDGDISWSGYFNDATGQAHPILSALPTTDILALWVLGSTANDSAASLNAKQLDYASQREVDGSLSHTVHALGNGAVGLEWMETITAGEVTHASAGAGTSRRDGASSAVGAAAVLHMREITSGTPTVIIQDAPDNSTWATLISFSAISDGAEPTAERKTVTGTVDEDLRINTTGTFVNADFIVAIRRGLSEDDEVYT